MKQVLRWAILGWLLVAGCKCRLEVDVNHDIHVDGLDGGITQKQASSGDEDADSE